MGLKACLADLCKRMMFGYKSSEKRFVDHLRGLGMRVGDGVHLYSPQTIMIDEQRPWMVSIGDNVQITANVSILAHDYSWSVVQRATGEVLGRCARTRIGNNVFIGQRSLILMGADIGDNVIIGAGSVVGGRVEADSVYAGVPARRICGLDEYMRKRKATQADDAALLVRDYESVYGKRPTRKLLREFFWLFEPRDRTLPQVYRDVIDLQGTPELSEASFYASDPTFDGFDAFLRWAERCADSDKSLCSNSFGN